MNIIDTLPKTTFSGRRFTRKQLAQVQETVQTFTNLSRKELSLTLCEHLSWKTPNGKLKVNSCLTLWDQLESQGVITLPAKRKARAPVRPVPALDVQPKKGKTQGRGRFDPKHEYKQTIKDIYVYPLESNWRHTLTNCHISSSLKKKYRNNIQSSNTLSVENDFVALWEKVVLDLPLSRKSSIAPSSFCTAQKKLDETAFKQINQRIIATYAQEYQGHSYQWLGHRIFAVSDK